MKLDEGVKNYLETASFALIMVMVDLGAGEEPVIFLKSTRDVLQGLKEAAAPLKAAWVVDRTGNGPVACLAVSAEVEGVGGFSGEIYFDPFEEVDLEIMNRAASAERIMAAAFDEEMGLVFLSGLKWDELERLEASQAADRAEELAENALLDGLELDFDRAMAAFKEKWPLKKLEKLINKGN